MGKSQFEVADIISKYLPSIDKTKIYSQHIKILSAIQRCRTIELGGHIDKCDNCSHLRISYNSCRNRHCPKCQGINKEMWIIQQEDMLLPVAYYHVVFTLPEQMHLLCMYNPRIMYDLLFQSAWHVINTLSRDPKWIGARPAATMILHTWGQRLNLHPHLHCIVPNGGLCNDGEWKFPKYGKDNFLYPVAVMRSLFKGVFMSKLKHLFKDKKIVIPSELFAKQSYTEWKNNLYKKEWVVFTKKPFSKPQHVIDYLGRYSHRVAITNRRIKSIDCSGITFEYKDYYNKAKKETMTLSAPEFIRRYCLHFLPPNYRKIRQYGLISNACKGKALTKAKKALGEKQTQLLTKAERKAFATYRVLNLYSADQCPCCKKGIMKMIIPITKNKPPPENIMIQIRKQNKNR